MSRKGTMRRVVITGMGMISPLGVGVNHNWERLLAGNSGVRRIEHLDVSDLPAQIAGMIPRGDQAGEYDPQQILSVKEINKSDPFIHYALVAAQEAIEDAGWTPQEESALERTSVIIGSGVGGFHTTIHGTQTLDAQGPRRISPFIIPAMLINLSSGQIGIKYGFRGANYSVVSACATGSEALICGARSILLDECDVAVVGGTDATIERLCIAGFSRAKSLSTHFNDHPEQASRPFSVDRDGFVLAEGAGVLVVEEYEHAKRRGANIHAELVSYASVSDAYHITATSPEGEGEQLCLRTALKRGKLDKDQIDYVNAHATSTMMGDRGESLGLASALNPEVVSVSSTKSATGHTLGAAGAIEAIFTILALQNNVVPPTLNLHSVDPELPALNYTPLEAQQKPIRYALNNAFGFGSTKAALIFGRV